MFQGAQSATHLLLVREGRQPGECEQHRDDKKYPGEYEIGNPDRIGPVRPGARKNLKNQVAAEDRAERRAKGIERLRKVEPARSRAFLAQNRHIRIRGNLEHRKPESKDEQREKKKAVRNHQGRGIKKRAAQRGHKQSEDDTVLVANAVDRVAGSGRDGVINDRADEVSAEKGQLHQHRLKVTESEGFLESRNERIIQHRHESPHEEQGRHDRKGTAMGLSLAGLRSGGCSYCFTRSGVGCHAGCLKVVRFAGAGPPGAA